MLMTLRLSVVLCVSVFHRRMVLSDEQLRKEPGGVALLCRGIMKKKMFKLLAVTKSL